MSHYKEIVDHLDQLQIDILKWNLVKQIGKNYIKCHQGPNLMFNV